MKFWARCRFAMATVSVISKQICDGGTRLRASCSCTKGRKDSLPRLWPDRLMANRVPSTPSDTALRPRTVSVLATTQRSSSSINW